MTTPGRPPKSQQVGMPASSFVLPTIFGLTKLFAFLIGMIIVYGFFGVQINEPIDYVKVAQDIKAVNPFFKNFPEWFFYLFNGSTLRYMIAPAAGILCVFLAAGAFIQDIFNLKRYRDALRYVVSATFMIFMPSLRVDKGEKVIPRGQTNLIDSVGGPGMLIVEPWSAATTRTLRQRGQIVSNVPAFLGPFEMAGETVSLEDQQGTLDDFKTITRDGIQVNVQDVAYRFRMMPGANLGNRTGWDLPGGGNPFSAADLQKMAYSRNVQNGELNSWPVSVSKLIKGTIQDYVNTHDIDYLTSPRTDDRDPRGELRQELLVGLVRQRLADLGTELLWIDPGHLDIVDPMVDENRLNNWAAEWIGDANVELAFGEAKRQAYLEIGRAEAQAEYIVSITSALNDIYAGNVPKESLRQILLMRTAQVLEALADQNGQAEKGRKP